MSTRLGAMLAVYVVLLCVVNPCRAADPIEWTIGLFRHHTFDSLEELLGRGVIVGYPDRTVDPYAAMTRYEFAAAWARLVEKLGLTGQPLPAGQVQMDVPPGHWARPAVERLVSVGVLPASAFSDVDPTHWAAGAVAALDRAGKPRLAYRGDSALLRRELAQFIHRTGELAHARGIPLRYGMQPGTLDAAQYALQTAAFIGYPDGSLRLDRCVTRLEFTNAAWRFLESFPSSHE